MNYCLTALLFFSSIALAADQIVVAENKTDWTALGWWTLIALAVVGIIAAMRHWPGAADKARAEAMELAHKAIDLAHKHADTKPSDAEAAAYAQAMKNQDRANQLRTEADAKIDADVQHPTNISDLKSKLAAAERAAGV